MKKILILGCNGFVGKSLTEYFGEKRCYGVTAVSHAELDLLDEKSVSSFLTDQKFDVVVHAAVWYPSHAKSAEDKMRGVEMNLRMFLNVARCENSFDRMIYFGSGAEYDKRRNIIDAKEEELEQCINSTGIDLPSTEYGFAKKIIGQLINGSDKLYNLRVFGLYGKYEDYRTKFITGCCAKAVLGLPLTIRRNVYFDYLYIDDFCKMIDKFIDLAHPKYHTYNIVSGQKVDLISLANCVKKISGKNLPIYVCNDGLGNEYTANGDRLQNEINYHDFVTYEDAIVELLSYFEQNKSKLNKEALLYQ